MAAKKNHAPPKARAKKGTSKTQPSKLKKYQGYLSAQKQSPAGPKLAAEAQDLQTKLDAYTAVEKEHVDLAAALEQKATDAQTAADVLDVSAGNFEHQANNVAAGDAAVLESLNVAVAADHGKPDTGPAPTPTGVTLVPDTDSGTAHMRWPRPPGAAAFIAQYKLEPVPGAPPADWLPADGYATKKLEWRITGLPPAAAVRGRVKAIGAEASPWSDEVLGKAR